MVGFRCKIVIIDTGIRTKTKVYQPHRDFGHVGLKTKCHGSRKSDYWYHMVMSRDGLVGYDAALTQLRSWVQFPFLV